METYNQRELTFYIPRTEYPKALGIADRLGVSVQEVSIDILGLAQTFYEVENKTPPPPKDFVRTGIPEYYDRARYFAERNMRIQVQGPHTGWVVVAMAEREEGLPFFYNIDPSAEYWSADNMTTVDFTRCDDCGVAHKRTRIFVVRKDNVVKQLGGSCAAHMDLTKKMRDLLDSFQQIIREFREQEWWDEKALRRGSWFNTELALLLADELIKVSGYVSRRKAEEETILSTSDQVKRILGPQPNISTPEAYTRARTRYAAEEWRPLLQDIQNWLATEPHADVSFTQNIRTALQSYNERYVGFLVYAVEGLRRAQLAKVLKSEPYCYQPETLTAEEIARQCETPLAELIPQLCDVVYTPGCEKKAKVAKALARVLPGVWRLRVWTGYESMYGYVSVAQFERSDGARVKYRGTGLHDSGWERGQQYLILSAQLGEDLGTHKTYGVEGRQIKRPWIIRK